MHRFIVCAIFLLACCGAGATEDNPVEALKKGQPADVAALIDRVVGCGHFAGEDGYDAARRRDIDKAMTKLRCDRVDGDENKLRQRYARNPAVLKALKTADEWSN